MLVINPLPNPEPQYSEEMPDTEAMLADGKWYSLAGLSLQELHQLQWVQEQRFAKKILACSKGSKDRTLVAGQAYDSISTIQAMRLDGDGHKWKLDVRYARFVLELMNHQIRHGLGQPRLFEIGYGCGKLLKEISDHGFPVSGVELSTTIRKEALQVLGAKFTDQLLLGDLRGIDRELLPERPTLVYWNNVFERICPDEIGDYLHTIYHMLLPGGSFVTITSNWLLRPADVTGDFYPPRSEACGLHLKEYRLAEVTRLLKQAGFRRVTTPLAASKGRIYLAGGGLRLLKQWCEPLIDKLPVRHARRLSRGMGMSITVATK